MKNFPLISINNKGHAKITSINNNGLITNEKTFLGEYFSHTFDDLFLSHRDDAGLDIKLYEKIK